MNARKALVVAVLAIFATALVAEFAGLVNHEPRAAAAHADGHAVDSEAASASLGISEAQLRIGVMGGFVLVCFYAVMRSRGVL